MESIINIHINSDKFGDLSWADEWKHALEMDLFDDTFAQGMLERLKSLTSRESGWTQNDSEIAAKEGVRLLRRLSIMALSGKSRPLYLNSLFLIGNQSEVQRKYRAKLAVL